MNHGRPSAASAFFNSLLVGAAGLLLVPGLAWALRPNSKTAVVLVATFLAVIFLPTFGHAQDATWLVNPASGDWHNGANWSTGSTPYNIATFSDSSVTSLTISDASYPCATNGAAIVCGIGTINFSAGAPGYTFTIGNFTHAPAFAFSNQMPGVDPQGIVNNSGIAPTFNLFGGLFFYGSTTAADAIITVYKPTATNSQGSLVFNENSTAAKATIVNNADLQFNGFSTAGNATITTNDSGTTQFTGHSTGGQARFITNAGGVVSFFSTLGPLDNGQITAGSIAGAGLYLLSSSTQLTVGSNNLSTEVSGTIGNGGCCAGAGDNGSIVKVGTGTLTLSGTNDYTGGTTINGGVLQVNGSIAASTLTTVNNGGTLDGIGIVGSTQINIGGVFMPGNGAAGSAMTVSGNLAFQSGAFYLVSINPATASFANVTGAATLGGATVSAFYASGSYVSKQYTILTAGGGVSGTFGSLVNTNLPLGFSSSLSYDNYNAYLDLKLEFSVPSGGLPTNQQNVANALTNYFSSNGSIPIVFGTLTPAGLAGC